MIPDNKKLHLVSYDKLKPEILAIFNEKYPGGVTTCLDDLQKYPRPDGTAFYAVNLETEDSIWIVKIPVQVDDPEDVEKWLAGEEVEEVEQVAGVSDGGSGGVEGTLPDDNISQYGGEDDDSSE